jgi:hypothetical protein
VLDRAQAVLQGRALDVAVGLRRAATRKQLSPSQHEPVDKAADYIDHNPEQLPYDQVLELKSTEFCKHRSMFMPRNTYPLDKSRPWFLIGASDLSAKNTAYGRQRA